MTRVLIATKTTAWEWHGHWYDEQYARGSLPAKDYERIKQAHGEHHESVKKVEDKFTAAGIDYRIVNVDHVWMPDDDSQVIVTLGGDGTLLSASHRVGVQPIILYGIRSSGTSVGYLCAGGLDRLDDLVSSLKTANFTLLEAHRLQAEIHAVADGSVRLSPPALNDFLYSHANPAETTRYRLTLGERIEDHKSSGMWLSTALGSTAGIYAAGGVIMPRSDRNFQFVVRELYREPGKNFYLVNGFFDPDRKTITVENRCEGAILAADGSHGLVQVAWGDRIVFKRATPIRIAQ